MKGDVRWGILSTAKIGRALVKGIGRCSGCCVQGVSSREWTRANEWAKEHGIPRAFGSYDELLKSGEVDLVYNPLPNAMHAEWTIKALEAGLPVLCEKPFASNARQAREMLAAAERTGLLLAEAFMYRFHPVYDRVLGLMAEGAIGDLTSIRSVFAFRLTDRSNIRASAELAGGALMDVGCYCVNLSRRLAGCEPVRACAFERRTTVDDTFFGQLEFPNGVVAQFECSIDSYARQGAEITGTEGAIILEDPWFPGKDRAKLMLRRKGLEEVIDTPGANCYHLEVEDFVRAYKTGTPPCWPPEDAVANMAVIDALYESANAGMALPVLAV
jgi:xylose dehydrogenase (NAD/NADP)